MNKKNILIFLAVLSIGIIITYPAFAPSHALDSYCTVYNGYKDTAVWFLQNGRVFLALDFLIYNLLHLPYDSLSFVTMLLMNLTLAVTITKLYSMLKKGLNIQNELKKGILLVSTFLLFYNPLFTELLVLNEGFAITLSILFLVYSVDKIDKGGIVNYIFGIILMILSIFSYQGTACYLFPILILVLLKNKFSSKEEIISALKKFGVAIIAYISAFLSTFGIIKLVSAILNEPTPKLGNVDILANLNLIFTDLIPTSLKQLYGFINPKFYYLFVLILAFICVYLLVKNKNKKCNVILLILLLFFTIFTPFAPNIVMSTDGNYSAARMVLILGSIPSILIIYMLSRFDFNIKLNYMLAIIIVLVGTLTAYTFHSNAMIDKDRYRIEMKYFKTIKKEIDYHDKNVHKIKTVYYAKDTNVDYYYSFGHANGINIRIFAIDWALDCAFPVYVNDKYEYKKMSEKDYNKYFKDKDYTDYNAEQIQFSEDKAYILLY